MNNLPFFVEPYPTDNPRFVTFYMDDADIAKIQTMFAHCGGGEDRWMPFYVKYNNQPAMNEALDNPARSDFLNAIEELEERTYAIRREFDELLHKGYKAIIGLDGTTFAVVKGRIKANQHTRYVLTEKPSKIVLATIKDYLRLFVEPSIELIKRFSPKN